MPASLPGLKEVRERLERDVSLLRPESLDPDMLDERARAILNLAHKDDLVMLKRREPRPTLQPARAQALTSIVIPAQVHPGAHDA